jgi:hypothetical protein
MAHTFLSAEVGSLVNAAWRRRRAVWSPQGAEGKADYFPASCEYESGSLPVPPAEHRGQHVIISRSRWPTGLQLDNL